MHGVATSLARAGALLVLVVSALGAPPARAADPPVACDPIIEQCSIDVGAPGSPGDPGGGGGPSGPACQEDGTAVPCSSSSGVWSNKLQCYLKLFDPQPPEADEIWAGHVGGAVYLCTTALTPTSRRVWLPAPPDDIGPTPEELARRALASLTLPSPVMRRSPTEANSDGGVPYTWVNLWTWYWTEPASWKVLEARAQAGPVWAEVTVTPVRMVYTAGDGAKPVQCAGPGRAWTEADGNAAPSAGGCGYRYRRVSQAPVTATLSIDWEVTWRGAGGTGGTLPAMQTDASASFTVQQIQVVTR